MLVYHMCPRFSISRCCRGYNSFVIWVTFCSCSSVTLTSLFLPKGDLLGLASSGWRYYDGSMYFFSKDEKPWKEAEDTCVLHRAHLTSVTSQKEMVSTYLSSGMLISLHTY